MSTSGGGSQTTVTAPWTGAQPYIRESFDVARNAMQNPAQWYPGQSFVGPTPGEIGAWDQRLGYSDEVFGGAQTPDFGQATAGLSNLLQGGAGGGLNTQDAFARMLSGTPDYAGLQGAIDAANAPILRQFEEEFIPGLNQRATFLNNETGGIKALNRTLPALGERMSQNALGLTLGERNRALGEQGDAARFLSSSQDANMLRGLGLFPGIAEMGQYPGQLAGQFADWGRGFQEQQLGNQMGMWDFYQNQPQDMASWYSNLVGGLGGLGQTSRSTGPRQNTGLNALGGAAAGASLLGGLGMSSGLGAGLGALLAFI